MENLTPTEIQYVTKLTALLKAFHDNKTVDLTDSEALQKVLADMTGTPTSVRLKSIQDTVVEAAVQHLTRTLN